ncbi:hypothetical protein ABNF65_22505, partial [Paenibacillus larvae]
LKIRARQISPNYTRVIEVENAVMIARRTEETVNGYHATRLVGWLDTVEELQKLVKKKLIMGLICQKEGSQTVYTFDFIYPLELISMEEYTILNKEFFKLRWERSKQTSRRETTNYHDPFTMIVRQFGEGYTRVIEAYEAILVKRQTEEPACIVKWICEPEDLEPLFREKLVHNLSYGNAVYKGERKKICTFDLYYPYEFIDIEEFYSLTYTYAGIEYVMKQKKLQR